MIRSVFTVALGTAGRAGPLENPRRPDVTGSSKMAVHDLQQTVVPRSSDEFRSSGFPTDVTSPDIVKSKTNRLSRRLIIPGQSPSRVPSRTQHTCCTSLRIDFFASDRLRGALLQPRCRNCPTVELKPLHRIPLFPVFARYLICQAQKHETNLTF